MIYLPYLVPGLRPRRCCSKTQLRDLRRQRSHADLDGSMRHFIFTDLHGRQAFWLQSKSEGYPAPTRGHMEAYLGVLDAEGGFAGGWAAANIVASSALAQLNEPHTPGQNNVEKRRSSHRMGSKGRDGH